MNKGFTLIETLVTSALLLVAILSSARIIVSAMDQTRRAGKRFRLLEKLDSFKSYLSSLPMAAFALSPGCHAGNDREFRVDWRVEAEGAFLKRVRLEVAGGKDSQALVFFRSKFIQEIRE